MTNYDVYLFDLDGTLTDTSKIWLEIYRDALKEFGISGLTDKEIAAQTHDWKHIVNLGLDPKDLPEFTSLAYRLCNERIPHAPFHRGAEEMLSNLRSKGKILGIFTTMDRPLLEPVIKQKLLDEKFDVIVAGTDVENRKPQPDGVLYALKKLGHQPSEKIVYIGDKDTDILCGRNAGVETILFFPSHHGEVYDRAPLEASEPHHEISDWNELLV
ncbi:MAG TPA: HAD-IA family hydrolase [Candidatus Saccharimonadales bacterium]|nr:HAD-IA family hydrolase [Candidatus Saccharimonadales bacterium]